MVKGLGGTLNWYCGSLDTNNKKTSIKDLNVNIKVYGSESGLRCDFTACDGKSTLTGSAVKASNAKRGLELFRMYEEDEKATFMEIFGLDGNKEDFSNNDWNLLCKQNGKRTYTKNKHFYTVNVNEDIITVKLYNDRSNEVGEIILDKETKQETETRRNIAAEAARKEAEDKEAKRQEDISNLITKNRGFELISIEEKENKQNDNKKEEFIEISITKKQSLCDIRNSLNLKEGDLIKYNPELKNNMSFIDKIINRLAGVQLLDIIDVKDCTISVPTSSIDNGKYVKQ